MIWNLSVKRKNKVKGDKRAQMQKRLLNYHEKQVPSSQTESTKIDRSQALNSAFKKNFAED